MNVNNIKAGPCKVYIEGSYIGATQGGVVINSSYEIKKYDLLDANPSEDIRLEHTDLTVLIPFAETTLDNLFIAMPWAESVSISSKRIIHLKNEAVNLRPYAKEIKLEPTIKTSDNEIITIHKAVPTTPPEISYKLQQRIYTVTFSALTRSATDSTLISFGDPTT